MLYVFGDSHTQIIGGGEVSSKNPEKRKSNKFEFVKINWLPSALAYNLIDDNDNLLKWGEYIWHKMENASDITSVLLVFGEIDIRVHIIKRSIENNIDINEMLIIIANRLIKFAEKIKKKFQKPIFILAPIPSAPNFKGYNPEVPNTGSETDRNYVTKEFSAYLERNSKEGVYTVNIFEELTDPLLYTNETYYADEIHLNTKGLKVFIKKINKIMIENKLNLINYFEINKVTSYMSFKSIDIFENTKIYEISSNYFEKIINKEEMRIIFHTEFQKNPYIIFDIGYVSPLEYIKLFNRKGYEERCENLKLSISDMPSKLGFTEIYKHAGVFGINEEYLKIDTMPYLGKIRFIKLELESENYFHLQGIEMLEKRLKI